MHGQQQLSLFNAHYDERCFLPIHIYEATSGKPVAMILRAGKTPSGEEVRTVLKHVIKRIRQALAQGAHPGARRQPLRPRRGDGVVREANDVDYIFGFAGNRVLHALTRETGRR